MPPSIKPPADGLLFVLAEFQEMADGLDEMGLSGLAAVFSAGIRAQTHGKIADLVNLIDGSGIMANVTEAAGRPSPN